MNSKIQKIVAIFIFVIILFGCMLTVYGAETTNVAGDYIFFLKPNEKNAGDAIVIQSGQKFALIDTGSSKAEQRVIKFLVKTLGIKEFEFVILTHGHEDHVGNFKAILDANINIKKLYMKDYSKMENPIEELPEDKERMLKIENLIGSNKITHVNESNEGKKIAELGKFKFFIYNTRLRTGDEIPNDNINAISTLIQHTDSNGAVKSNIFLASDIENYEGSSKRPEYNAESNVIEAIRKKLGNANIDVYMSAHHGYRKNSGKRNANSAESFKKVQPFSYLVIGGNPKDENGYVQNALNELKNSGLKNDKNILYTYNNAIMASFNSNGNMANIGYIEDNSIIVQGLKTGTNNAAYNTKLIKEALEDNKDKGKDDKGNIVYIKAPNEKSVEYYINGSMPIYSNTKLKLDNNVKITAYNMTKGSMLYAPNDKDIGKYDSFCNITVEGGTWNGNKVPAIFTFRHGSNIEISNLKAENTSSHAINVSASEKIRIHDVTIENAYKNDSSTALYWQREAIHLDSAGKRRRLFKGLYCS